MLLVLLSPVGGCRALFQKSEFGYGQGGATVSLSLADAVAAPAGRSHWRERLRDYCEEVNLVPDLGQRIGSFEWFRGALTCTALCASALYLSPGFAPIPSPAEPVLTDRQFDEARPWLEQATASAQHGAMAQEYLRAIDEVTSE